MGPTASKKQARKRDAASQHDYTFNAIFLGKRGAGKTSLLNSLAEQTYFTARRSVESRTVVVDYAGVKVMLNLSDTSTFRSFPFWSFCLICRPGPGC
jgi:septin family protein